MPDFDVDEFSDSYGGRQKVASVIRRSLGGKRMHYRINGGRKVRTTRVREWRGGERYGDDGNHYFAEYRGKVEGPATPATASRSGSPPRRRARAA